MAFLPNVACQMANVLTFALGLAFYNVLKWKAERILYISFFLILRFRYLEVCKERRHKTVFEDFSTSNVLKHPLYDVVRFTSST